MNLCKTKASDWLFRGLEIRKDTDKSRKSKPWIWCILVEMISP